MPMAVAGVDPAAPSPSHAPASRQDLHAAIAKAVELRQLHAALLQRGTPNAHACASPAVIRLPPTAASPARSRTADEGYPVFTPVYDEEERVAGMMSHICKDNNRSLSENWSSGGDDALHGCFKSSTSELLFPASTDHRLHRNRGAAYKIHPAFLHSAPSADHRFLPSSAAGRMGMAHASDLKLPPATCSSAFRPATIGRPAVPPQSAHSSSRPTTKPRGPPQILSWLFPARSKKKATKPPPPPETMPSPTDVIERENVSRLLTEWGALSSLDTVKKELAEAHAHRDAALREAAEVRASVGELAAKLASLEAYCSELKNALRHTTTSSASPSVSRRSTRSAVEATAAVAPTRSSEAVPGMMPVSHDVMVEGFLQVASEARLAVKQLCKALIHQVDVDTASNNLLSDKLNLLLRPYHLALPINGNNNTKTSSSSSKAALYHLESIMNQAMYQDFENRAFQRDGAPRLLDPARDRRQNFDAFAALRNLSWNEVLRKGTKYYSEDFGRFCDRKMGAVVAALGWTRPWPEQLLHCFFVAAKCAWLLHLLAFSFHPPLAIMRVQEGRAFDPVFMEDVLLVQQSGVPCQVKVMVMPGFYVQDRVLKCRVLTTSTSTSEP
ncbi:hypothetical protein PR202_ga15439 [Eleusine coracana subsp. coracana]|uniref:GIL1/IRKI C-terminal domain-containing protein n=1 Tax=Eleusine coracana subsp. coracana TaxID=191504 RepID=A0AAV5CK41_ELECO|nr:hypothetical protein QOZ80_6BG0493010 [Eleusine coracana subsp. coracana]GJM98425.1 hypothetical protein PR202_ga15439 [Eleusine coracana subsp. coracana]